MKRRLMLRIMSAFLCCLLLFGEVTVRADDAAHSQAEESVQQAEDGAQQAGEQSEAEEAGASQQAENDASSAQTEAAAQTEEAAPPEAAGRPALVTLSKAVALPEGPEVVSDFAILVEARSGAILYEKNAYGRAAPASITKIMTALLIMENCEMSETVFFSYRACHELASGSSTISRTEGEEMSVLDCLYGLLVASANEVAQALAEHLSGSIEAFVARMNQRAEELGCVNTHFANPHGTPDDDHYTCAYDMALILREAMQHDRLREIMGTAKAQIAPTNKHDEITYLRSKHPLVTDYFGKKYEGAVAGKTGYTSEALNTLATYAVRGDMDLICIVLHADGATVVGDDSAALFNYGFANYTRTNMMARAAESANDRSFLGSDILDLDSVGGCYVTLPNGTSPDELAAGIHYGSSDAAKDQVAVKEYSLNGVVLASLPLKVDPVTPKLPITPEINHEPSTKDILRTKYLGLALIYWIIIGGSLVVLGLLALLIYGIIRLFRHNKKLEERSRRSLSRMERQEKNEFF